MSCNKCLHKNVCPHLKDTDAERCQQYANEDEYIKIVGHKKQYTTNGKGKTIGQIIYEKRKTRGWTEKKLAEMIDVHPATIAYWEYGKSYPNAIFLASLADVFECTIDELCGRVICQELKEH